MGMRRSLIILTALFLTGGTAMADRDHHGGGGRVVNHGNGGHGNGGGHYNGGHVNGGRSYSGGHTYNGGHYNGARYNNTRVYHGGGRFVASGHYYDHGGYREWRGGRGVRWEPNHFRGYYYSGGYYRPWSGVHYYNHYRRPAVIVENWSPVAGYYWVGGNWQWDGAEWMWYPGHMEAY